MSSLRLVDPLIIPSPGDTISEFRARLSDGSLAEDAYWTLRRLVVGFAAGSLVGVILGYLVATSRAVENAIDWPIQAMRSISPLALVPLTVLWFGIDETQKYFLIAITVVFPVLLNVQAAVRNVPNVLLRAAFTLGCRDRWAQFRHVILPHATPHVIEGLRVGLGIGFLVIIAAEMIGASRGLGNLIFYSGQQFNTPAVFVGIITIAFLGVAADRLVLLAKKILVPWSE